MPFHFPLESVLHLRQSVEHQQELRLRAMNRQLNKLRHSIEQVDARIRELHMRSAENLAAGTTAAELRFVLTTEISLRRQGQKLDEELIRLRAARDQQENIFRRARRERETFESLRERQRSAYGQEKKRREQRHMDDLFLLIRACRPS